MPPLRIESYHANEGVYWNRFGTETVILDLNSGRYFMLLGSGAEVWDLAVEGLPQSLIEERHASKYLLSTQKAHSDVSDFIKGLITLRLLKVSEITVRSLSRVPARFKPLQSLQPRERAAGRKAERTGFLSRALSFIKAIAMLLVVDVGLCLFGLHRISKWISSVYLNSEDADGDVVRSLAQIPQSAYRWYRPGAACTQRAVATYWYLRSRGIGVHLCIGAATQPFASHCWVEYEGKPTNEIHAEVRQFTVIARII